MKNGRDDGDASKCITGVSVIVFDDFAIQNVKSGRLKRGFKMATEFTRKVTLTLPQSLLIRLDATVPGRKRSRFIAEAIEERLAIAEQLAALEETAGAWSDERHPDMRSEADIDQWLTSLRAAWRTPGADRHV